MRRGLLVGVLWLAGCASAPPSDSHAQFVHDLLLGVEQLQLTEIDLARRGVVSPADHRRWQEQFKYLAQATQVYVRAVQAGQQPTTATLNAALTTMSAVLLPRIMDTTARLALQAAIDGVRVLLATRQTARGPTWTLQPSAC